MSALDVPLPDLTSTTEVRHFILRELLALAKTAPDARTRLAALTEAHSMLDASPSRRDAPRSGRPRVQEVLDRARNNAIAAVPSESDLLAELDAADDA